MRAIFLAAAITIAITTTSQVSIAYTEKIYSADNKNLKVAGFASDASFVLLTTDEYKGLSKLDTKNKLITPITDKKDAGYNCQITNDNKSVIFKETYETTNGEEYSAFIEYNLSEQKRHMAYMPYISAEKTDFSNRLITLINLQRLKLEKKQTPTIASTRKLQLLLTQGIDTKVLSPNGQDQSYIWVSLSPDGKKVCYYVTGHGCYICDISGDNIQFMSRYYINAKWLNNDILTATEIRTDDSNTHSSRLVAFTTKAEKTPLTKYYNGTISQYPAGKSEQIAYSDNNGAIYIIHLITHKNF